MKKIINWSFGAFFRTIGRIFAYLVIGVLILIIGAKSGLKLFLMPVKASTVAVSNAKFNLYTAISRDEKLCAKPTSYGYKNIDTNINTTDRPYVNHIDYLFETNLRAGQSYTITFVQSYNPKTDVVARPDGIRYRIEGSTTTNDSGLSADNISTFKCFLTNDTNNNVKVNVTCNVVPLNNVKKIWISQIHNYCGTYIKGFNTYFLEVNQNSATEDAINIQTEIIKDGQDKIIKGQDKINDTLNDEDTSEAGNKIKGFFNDFTTNTHGLTGIISSPLNAIQSLTSKTCTPLVLPLPFVDKDLTLPCMRQIYTDNFGAFMNLYDVIIIGIVSYWVMVRIFTLVKDFKNPDHDEVEVVDL